MSDTEMCNSVVYRQFNEFIEPFPFSRFQLFKTCSRLILPTDSRQHFIVAKDNQSCETLPTINGSDKHQRRLSHEMENPLHSKPMVVFSPSIAYQNNLDSQIIPTKLNAKTSPFTPENSKINSKFATGPVHMPTSLNYSNIFIKRQRGEKRPIPDEQKDEKYYERRKRNNEAAKKSRDARKLREDRIALRAAILEHENALLRAQLISLRDEITTLKQMMVSVAAPVSLNF